MARKSVTIRTAERLSRSAYEFEELAARLRSEGFGSITNEVKAISSSLGNCGRVLYDKLEKK